VYFDNRISVAVRVKFIVVFDPFEKRFRELNGELKWLLATRLQTMRLLGGWREIAGAQQH
jgi:hypothetical protein